MEYQSQVSIERVMEVRKRTEREGIQERWMKGGRREWCRHRTMPVAY